jgi:hypothetical protein
LLLLLLKQLWLWRRLWLWRCDLWLLLPPSNYLARCEGRFVAAVAVAQAFVTVAVALQLVARMYAVVKLRRGGVLAFIKHTMKSGKLEQMFCYSNHLRIGF